MAEDKPKKDWRDATRVDGGEEYEARRLAKTAKISVAQARQLIEAHGLDRPTLEREAKKLA
jgi:hypothetical protein